jgi:CheY-like chemotaxis protein
LVEERSVQSSNLNSVEESPELRVLIVDDDEEIRHALRLLFEIESFTVVDEAADGYEAIKLAELHQPDYVILDYRMPLLNGADAARIIRAVAPLARIVAFSAHLEDRPAWADNYLNKERIAEIAPLLGGFVDRSSAGTPVAGMSPTHDSQPSLETIVHELRGPAWVVKGLIEKMIDAGERYDREEQAKILQLVLQNLEKLAETVEELEVTRKHLEADS